MPIPIRDLLGMPKGTRELNPLGPDETPAKFQRRMTGIIRQAGVARFESCLIITGKTVMDGVWMEVLKPLDKKR